MGKRISIGILPTSIDDAERRQLLAKIYELLLRLGDEKDDALSGKIGEEMHKAKRPATEL